MPVPEVNSSTAMPIQSLYETDLYAWTQEQAALLRNHQLSQLDLPNLIEEIESLGKQLGCPYNSIEILACSGRSPTLYLYPGQCWDE